MEQGNRQSFQVILFIRNTIELIWLMEKSEEGEKGNNQILSIEKVK
jgi:hypothetical protein